MPALESAARGAADRYETMGYTVLKGIHTIPKASLLILDSLERLQGPCPSQEWVTVVVYMVAKGIPVTTVPCCDSVGGDVRKLPRADLLEHVPATASSTQFIIHEDFKLQFGEVLRALRVCASASGSKWSIGKTPASGAERPIAPKPAGSGIDANSKETQGNERLSKMVINNLPDLWSFLQQSRRLRNGRSAAIFWGPSGVTLNVMRIPCKISFVSLYTFQ